jgi:hypothetical protein
MEKALNRRWAWNDRKPVPQTDFPQPTGIVVEEVCKYSGMLATSACGETREVPFLEGTVPEPDNVHEDGCFDIVQEIRQDERRPQEWIDSAALFADRVVNGNLGAVGDPTELKENPDYRLAIRPVAGNTGYGSPICGELRATPKPSKTPKPSGGGPRPSEPAPSDACQGNPHKCTPEPTLAGETQGPGARGTDVTVIVPAFLLTIGTWLLPLAVRTVRRRRHP